MSPHQLNNMKKQKPLIAWYMILAFVFTLSSVLIPTANATIISFQEQYQDYTGAFHLYTTNNIEKYPLYIIIDNGNTYTVSRIDDSIEFIKQNTTYSFENNKISFTLNLTPQQLNSRSNQDGANWYINIPKPLTSKRFTWDFKKPVVTTNTGSVISSSDFWFTNENGQPRLYYNQAARNVGALSTYIKFEFNSFIVNNVTSAGWTDANITLNGSRFTDNGLLAINLRNNSSLNMTNLTAYWSLDEETGLILHNINNESGLPNSTNQGTWNGNATLNYTTGKIGNAGLFDGVDDYVDVGNDASLNFGDVGDKYSISGWVNMSDVSSAIPGTIISKIGVSQPFKIVVYSKVIEGSIGDGVATPGVTAPVSNNTWYNFVFVVDRGNTIAIYINGSLVSSALDTTVGDIRVIESIEIGTRSHAIWWLNGSVDEIQLWHRLLSAPEIATLYNTSMRTQGNVTIWKQNSILGGAINRTRLIVNNTQTNNNTVNLYTKPNSSTVWNLTAINISSNTWYDIDVGNQSTSQDFLVAMSGNGSDTPFFTSLEWDETLIPVVTPPISCANAYRDINSAFQLIGILLILFAAMMIIIGIQNYNNPSYLIMGATSGVIGAVMLAVGVFVVITVGTGAGCV